MYWYYLTVYYIVNVIIAHSCDPNYCSNMETSNLGSMLLKEEKTAETEVVGEEVPTGCLEIIFI